MKIYYVYMLLCADGSFYAGITSNLELRLGQHEFGVDPNCYTYKRRPVRLVYASDFLNVDDAIAWEKHVKGWSRAKKRALVAGVGSACTRSHGAATLQADAHRAAAPRDAFIDNAVAARAAFDYAHAALRSDDSAISCASFDYAPIRLATLAQGAPLRMTRAGVSSWCRRGGWRVFG
ncbi:MAG: GIY-YIG nuclease family protein, partial [Candidatus Cybelea sp.]